MASAAGHHRVEAARRAGLTEADICVGDFDDQTMVRIYARENATQRTKQVTALDGSVLAAVRWLARRLLTGIYREIATDAVFESEKAFDVAKGILINGGGVGQPLISKVLNDMPGMTEHSIRDSLSRLKASGNYARTLLAITRQIEAEAEAARHFRRFRRHPWGGIKPAEIVQELHIWPKKLYSPRLKIVVQGGLAATGRAEGRILAGNL